MADTRKVPQTEWDSHKAVIFELYQKKTLAEMMILMESTYRFYASKAQYIRQLKKWGVEKYSTNEKWKSAAEQVQKRKLEGKETEILINGTPVPWKKLKKEMARYAAAQAKVAEESAGPSAGVIARTPPREEIYTPSIEMADMPWFQFQDLADSLFAVPRFAIQAGFDQFGAINFTYTSAEWDLSMGLVNDFNIDPLLALTFHQDSLGSHYSYSAHQQLLLAQLLDQADRRAQKHPGECLDESIDPDNVEYSSRISRSLREIAIERHNENPEQHVKKLPAAVGEEALFQLLRFAAYLSSNNLLSDTKTDNILAWVAMNGKFQDLEPLLNKRLPTAEIFASNLLVSAVRLNKEDFVRALLMKGTDPNGLAGSEVKKTALFVAVEQENIFLVQMLLDFKADPNVCNHSGHSYCSLLGRAISGEEGGTVIAKMLIAAGADVNAPVDNAYQGGRQFAA
ncbi:hypothetical protein FDECE_1047, partial [Fusarium decemcellulare]